MKKTKRKSLEEIMDTMKKYKANSDEPLTYIEGALCLGAYFDMGNNKLEALEDAKKVGWVK